LDEATQQREGAAAAQEDAEASQAEAEAVEAAAVEEVEAAEAKVARKREAVQKAVESRLQVCAADFTRKAVSKSYVRLVSRVNSRTSLQGAEIRKRTLLRGGRQTEPFLVLSRVEVRKDASAVCVGGARQSRFWSWAVLQLAA
jgi:hypothetical protein